MADQTKTYRGNCHCGAYIYEVKAAEKPKVGQCNCSSCYKKGVLWLKYNKEDFNFVKGDPSTLSDYTFGTKSFHHKFCSNCGNQLLFEGSMPGVTNEPFFAFNTRTIQPGQGFDVWEVERYFIDGKSLGVPYEPTKYTGPEPQSVEGGKRYTGSCHCGAVRVVLNSKPLDKSFPEDVKECNCSMCSRQGCTWIYPKTEFAEIEGEENLKFYTFSTHLFGKSFCKTCGVPVHNKTMPITDEQFNKLSQGHQEFVKGSYAIKAMNLRLIDGLDVGDLNVGRWNGYNDVKPAYVEP